MLMIGLTIPPACSYVRPSVLDTPVLCQNG